MWALDNRTAYAAAKNWIRDRTGGQVWLVAVRATFEVSREGTVKLADEQPPPLLEPQYYGDPGRSSLRLDSDLLGVKSGTDVLVEAHAHAPHGRAAATVPVSLRIGDLDKSLLVHGARVYYRGPVGATTSSPRPFQTRAIRYEWAFGGGDTRDPDPRKHRLDSRNPVGKGYGLDGARLENQPAHYLEYPRGNPAKTGPAGFGPLASFWSPRVERAGTYDGRWAKERKPLLPNDYDERFTLSAPDDQRPARPLRGGERLVLSNMTPEGLLRLELPKVFLTFRTRFGSRFEEHRATLTSVFLSTEEMRLSLTWQSSLRVRGRDVDYLDSTTIDEKAYIG